MHFLLWLVLSFRVSTHFMKPTFYGAVEINILQCQSRRHKVRYRLLDWACLLFTSMYFHGMYSSTRPYTRITFGNMRSLGLMTLSELCMETRLLIQFPAICHQSGLRLQWLMVIKDNCNNLIEKCGLIRFRSFVNNCYARNAGWKSVDGESAQGWSVYTRLT